MRITRVSIIHNKLLTQTLSSSVAVELGVVIGRKARDVKAEDAMRYIAGYTLAIDMCVLFVSCASTSLSINQDRSQFARGHQKERPAMVGRQRQV